jgi:cytochrome c oxidase subunit 2
MVVLMRVLILLALLSVQAPPADLVVDVTAERYSFTPSQVKSSVGKVIEFRVKSEDTLHGFRILGTDINVEVPKRGKGTAVVRFTPTEPGRYTFECSHTCGAGHAFMRGQIVVTK